MRMTTGRTIFEETPYLIRYVFFADSRTGLGRAGARYRIGHALAVIRTRNSPQY
jgi:hypothetical protein